MGLEPLCRATLAETYLTGGVFGNMFFQLPAPQRHEGPAAAVEVLVAGKIRLRAAQVAEGDPAGGHTRILRF